MDHPMSDAALDGLSAASENIEPHLPKRWRSLHEQGHGVDSDLAVLAKAVKAALVGSGRRDPFSD